MIDTKEQTALRAETTTTPIKVKKIGHVVYRVSDVERSVRFWTEIMGFKESDRNDLGMVFLRCQTDHHTVAVVAGKPGSRPMDDEAIGIHHFAMEVDSPETLFKAREFLKSKGVPISYEGRRGPGSNMGIEFTDPDGYSIELYYGMEQVGWDGKSRPAEFHRRAKTLEEAMEVPVPGGP